MEVFLILTVPYTTKHSRGKTFVVFADLAQPRMFSHEIFPSKFFSNNIALSSSLFLVVQSMVCKEYRDRIANPMKEVIIKVKKRRAKVLEI